jgi:glycosyltransferase involved in cell wall biosynthesis
MEHNENIKQSIPAISIIIPVFNRRKYLETALESIQKQTIDKNLLEIIVIKNFIEEKLDSKIAALGYKNMFFNGNMGGRLFTAINESHGEFISFLQDDDLFESEKIELIYKIFKSHERISFISNDYSEIDEDGVIINSRKKRFDQKQLLFSESDKRDFSIMCEMIKRGYDFNLSCMSIRKEILFPYLNELKKITGSDDSFIFFINIFASGNMMRINAPLTKYRVHNSATAKSGTMNEVLSINYLTFSRQIGTFILLKNLSKSIEFSKILNVEITLRKMSIDICSEYGPKRIGTFRDILFLISNHYSVKKAYLIKLIIESIITTFSKEAGKRLYYYYNKKKYISTVTVLAP